MKVHHWWCVCRRALYSKSVRLKFMCVKAIWGCCQNSDPVGLGGGGGTGLFIADKLPCDINKYSIFISKYILFSGGLRWKTVNPHIPYLFKSQTFFAIFTVLVNQNEFCIYLPTSRRECCLDLGDGEKIKSILT